MLERRRALISLPLSLLAGRTAGQAASEPSLPGSRLRVGPTEQFRTLGDAVRAARTGDTIEVKADDYRGDAAVLERDLVRIVGIGGRPRLIAAGAHAEQKGTLVVRARGCIVENLEFVGSRVPDHYGSGIRLEGGSLQVRECRFTDNELGLMTANDPAIVLEVIGCEFSGLVENKDRGSALSHCLYAGTIDSLIVEGSYFHDGSVGHLIKSRARTNFVRYNRLSDQNGIASYELEFPDGGVAEVVGNVIQQGRRSENGTIISYGAEGLRWKENRLDILFNTIVNDLPAGGYFVSVHRQGVPTTIRHNVLVGKGQFRLPPGVDLSANVHAKASDFADLATLDCRPRMRSSWVGTASGVEHAFDPRLLPARQYKHPAAVQELQRSRLGVLSPGAIQTLAP